MAQTKVVTVTMHQIIGAYSGVSQGIVCVRENAFLKAIADNL